MSRLDRRALFTTGAAAALLAATGASVQATPRRGGLLRIAVPDDDASLPALARGASQETLVEIAPNGVLRPELSLTWQSDVTARVWLFSLRDDVRFADDTPFDASQAALALQDPIGVYLGAEVEVVDPLTLRVSLAVPDPQLPITLTGLEFAVIKAGTAGHAFADQIGTGCYRLQNLRDGRHFRAQRVENHYKDESAGWADQIEVITLATPQLRAEALRDGYVDIAALPDIGELNRSDRMFLYHPDPSQALIAADHSVGVPSVIGSRAPLDDGRLPLRWWRA